MAALRRQLPGILRRAARASAASVSQPAWLAPAASAGVPAFKPFEKEIMAVPAYLTAYGGKSFATAAEQEVAEDVQPRGADVIQRGSDGYIVPHGGKLVNLMVTDQAEKEALLASCKGAAIQLNDRQACDVELLINGGFSPLEGFMNQDIYEGVVENTRIPGSNTLFGLPVVMDTFDPNVKVGQRIALHYQGELLAVLEVESKWQPNKAKEARQCYGWAYLPYSMHMAGPREALQHMLIRKNYGCTHFIIGRDMAGSKSSITGEDFYGPYEAQDFAKTHAPELGMLTVPSLNLVFTQEESYVTADVAKEKNYKPLKLSGTEFRRRLRAGEDIPEWFAFKSVVEVLRKEAQNASA
eukprot:jgi/Mesen1/9013/ME000563S08322